jgi:hypothetical protein
MHRAERRACTLDVQAHGIDHAIGAGNGGFYRALVMHIGGDPLDSVVAVGPSRMP